MNFEHISVLKSECIEYLNIKKGGIYFDCTLGGAGHSYEICSKLNNTGTLIGIDQDINAINAANLKLNEFKNVKYVNDNFSNINQICKNLNINSLEVDGFLLDLGVSSHQLDEAERGFSYMHDAPLDMRMDSRNSFTAHNVVNDYSELELCEIISKYGEERWSKRIAEFIVEERKQNTINTTFELVSIIKKAIPKGARKDGPHPAKRTFQAIRIEVNNELGILKNSIEKMTDLLKPFGRICVITFHSLEDRIIKNIFKELENPCICPREFPICVCGKKPKVKIITKKPVIPSEEEINTNHRARSAKLRVVEKLNI